MTTVINSRGQKIVKHEDRDLIDYVVSQETTTEVVGLNATGAMCAASLSASGNITAAVVKGTGLAAAGSASTATASQVIFTNAAKVADGSGETMYLLKGPALTNNWDVVDGGPANSMIWLGVMVGVMKYIVPAFCCSA